MSKLSKLSCAVVGAFLFLGAPLASAIVIDASDPAYNVMFTDVHGDVGDLTFDTNGSISPTGTLVTSISGTMNGISVSEIVIFGADQTIYSTGRFVDYPGVGFTNGTLYNLYWTNPNRARPGVYGICYEAGCSETLGFYAVRSLTVSGPEFSLSYAVPEAATWAMLLLGFAGLGFAGYRASRKGAALTV